MVNRLLTGFVKVNTSPTAESQSKRGSHYEEANSHGILELAAWFRLEQHRRKRLIPGRKSFRSLISSGARSGNRNALSYPCLPSLVNRLLTITIRVNIPAIAESTFRQGICHEEAGSHGFLELVARPRLEQYGR